MNDNVIAWPVIPKRYPPHLSLLNRLKDSREASKQRVQEMAEEFRRDTWRKEQVAQVKCILRALARHPDGGAEFAEMAAMSAIEDMRSITV